MTIIVKALNEEKRIEACLRSALAELQGLHGEVILADSLSSDRTVEIAARFAVEIVQFESAQDRGCGAAVQLGYQFARGRYIYVLDADMTLEPGFLARAMAYLESHPEVAAVGGRLIDTQVNNAADKMRIAHYAAVRETQSVASLGGGGLYRRSAVEAAGYLAHRWLPACEEAELGARLVSAGWRLVRLPEAAVSHSGHQESTLQMLGRQWRNRRMQAYGMFLRSALGRPWLRTVLGSCWFVFAAPLMHLTSLAIAALGAVMGGAFLSLLGGAQLLLWGAVFCALAWRKKSPQEALIAILAWHLYAVAALIGFIRPLGNPAIAIPARVLRRT